MTTAIANKIPDDVEWISVREAAGLLGVSHNTLRKMMDNGEISFLGEFSKRRDVVLSKSYILREADRRKNQKEAVA